MTQAIHPSVVNTPQGSVALLPPTRELLRTIRDLLPMGIMGIQPPRDGAAFGIPSQRLFFGLWNAAKLQRTPQTAKVQLEIE